MMLVKARDIRFRGLWHQADSVEAARWRCRRAASMVFAQ
jgi:hypothetical protein